MRPTLLAVLLLAAPSLAFAQFAPVGAAPLTLSISPANPRPGSTISVTPQSTSINLADATVVIYVNGKMISSGAPGPTAVTLGPSGTATTIKVVATILGQNYNASMTLNPGDVSLVSEPSTYAPVLYLGKPLVAAEGNVRVVAIADLRTSTTRELPADQLSYTWSIDGSELDNYSGIGRSVLIAKAPLQYRSSTVSVLVSSQDGSVVGSDSIVLTPVQPTFRIYASDPLQGILYDHALAGTAALTGSEGSFVAEPYSLSLVNGLPQIQWFLNGSAAQSGNSITLRPSGTGAGTATISATAGADSSASLNLTFGSSSGGIFGL